jgi:eukaryotic-like serine/threonine-protein kinase
MAVVAVAALVVAAALYATRDRDPAGTAVQQSPGTTATEPAPSGSGGETDGDADTAATTAAPSRPGVTAAPTTAARSGPTAAPRTEGVPREWVQYQDPVTGYAVAHPPGWTVSTNGTLTDIRDPRSAAYLRIDYTTAPGPSPVQAWLDFETTFAAENPNYERIQITPTTFKGYDAALWEFTYTGLGTDLHAADLGFVTGSHGFALNFQTRTEDWDRMQDVFEAFQASFQPPDA